MKAHWQAVPYVKTGKQEATLVKRRSFARFHLDGRLSLDHAPVYAYCGDAVDGDCVYVVRKWPSDTIAYCSLASVAS